MIEPSLTPVIPGAMAIAGRRPSVFGKSSTPPNLVPQEGKSASCRSNFKSCVFWTTLPVRAAVFEILMPHPPSLHVGTRWRGRPFYLLSDIPAHHRNGLAAHRTQVFQDQ